MLGDPAAKIRAYRERAEHLRSFKSGMRDDFQAKVEALAREYELLADAMEAELFASKGSSPG